MRLTGRLASDFEVFLTLSTAATLTLVTLGTAATFVLPAGVLSANDGVLEGLVLPANDGVLEGLVLPANDGVPEGLVLPANDGVSEGLVLPAENGSGFAAEDGGSFAENGDRFILLAEKYDVIFPAPAPRGDATSISYSHATNQRAKNRAGAQNKIKSMRGGNKHFRC